MEAFKHKICNCQCPAHNVSLIFATCGAKWQLTLSDFQKYADRLINLFETKKQVAMVPLTCNADIKQTTAEAKSFIKKTRQ